MRCKQNSYKLFKLYLQGYLNVIGARLVSYTRRLTVFGPRTGLRGGRKPRFEVEESTEWPKVWKVWNLGMIEDLRKRRN
jgi:hypothetical protein